MSAVLASLGLDAVSLTLVIAGALIAGFTTGLAGFGTGLVASGLWLHALPAPMVPPLVALASVAAQSASLVTVRKAFDWQQAAPFLAGGIVGLPLGLWALASASPLVLRTSIGALLIAYSVWQLAPLPRIELRRGGQAAESLVGIGGGFLGGFAGLSGPLPLIWLQLKGGSSDSQRAIYQPFNMVVLALASLGMWLSGKLGARLLSIAAICLPATLLAAWIGARVYVGLSPETFRRLVLCLLLGSGGILVGQALLLK